jgi:FkbM family methyltransferase
LLKKNDSAVDVGANVGQMTSLLSTRVGPGGTIYSFEPHPGLFKALRQNLVLWGRSNIELIDSAVSDCVGELQLVEPDSFHLNNGIARIEQNANVYPVRHKVRALTLSSCLPEKEYAVWKIDVEGHEDKVFAGAEPLLKAHLVRHIVFECLAGHLDAAIEHLAPKGYHLYAITSSIAGPRLIPVVSNHSPCVIHDFLATIDSAGATNLLAAPGWLVLRRVRPSLNTQPSTPPECSRPRPQQLSTPRECGRPRPQQRLVVKSWF